MTQTTVRTWSLGLPSRPPSCVKAATPRSARQASAVTGVSRSVLRRVSGTYASKRAWCWAAASSLARLRAQCAASELTSVARGRAASAARHSIHGWAASSQRAQGLVVQCPRLHAAGRARTAARAPDLVPLAHVLGVGGPGRGSHRPPRPGTAPAPAPAPAPGRGRGRGRRARRTTARPPGMTWAASSLPARHTAGPLTTEGHQAQANCHGGTGSDVLRAAGGSSDAGLPKRAGQVFHLGKRP